MKAFRMTHLAAQAEVQNKDTLVCSFTHKLRGNTLSHKDLNCWPFSNCQPST